MRPQPYGKTLLGVIAIIALATTITPASGQLFSTDLTLHETTTTTGMGAKTANAVTYLSGNAMKRSGADGRDVIMRFTEGKIISIDNNKKTYTEMTVQQLQKMLENLGAEMGQNKEGMEAMRKMMGQVADSVTVTKQGPGETIAGYSTEKYLVKGPMEMEIWAAPALKVPALYYDSMRMNMPRNPMFDMGKMYEEMKKVDGIPLKNVTTMKMMNMEMKTTTVVTSVEKGKIPPSTFDVPAGYKLVPNDLSK